MAAPAVRLDDLQLTVVPGEGLVARFGEVALLALSGGSGAAIDQLLATCRALGTARIDEPGAILVDQLDALLGERMPASPSFCVLATSAEGVEVVLCGEVEVTVARGGQVSRHAGPDPDTWVDLLVDQGFDWLVAVPLGSAEPPSDVRLDLHDGVVPGGGLRLTQRDRLPGEALPRREPDEPREQLPVETTAPGPAAAEVSPPSVEAPGGFVSVPLWRAPAPATRSPLPVATTSLDEPAPEPGEVLVPTLRCSAGHPNNPAATHCGWCGRSLVDGTARLVDRPQPTLGILLLDDGSSYTLDAGYLIGSMPDLANALSRGDVRPLVLPERDGVVPTHAEIALDGWAVTVADRAPDAGTWVRRPGDREWSRLAPSRPEMIVAESQIRVGERVLTFIAARRITGDDHSR
ncbi:MAG TPA: hypothetical protein VK461_01675 [Acidimicrobiales bacterium]|nr:hypothetical protein [Acidimicrobiales bacterium]